MRIAVLSINARNVGVMDTKSLRILFFAGALAASGWVAASAPGPLVDPQAGGAQDAKAKAEWAKRVFTGKEQYLEEPYSTAENLIDFSGFGTWGVTHTREREADYRANLSQPNGVGRSGAVMFGLDTKAGLQGTMVINERWTATLQVVADHRGDNSYSPEIEWANIKYAVSDDWYVRVGRVVAQPFTISDYRNVGYAITMVRPPYDLYSLTPLAHMDGGEIGAQFHVYGGRLNAQLSSGRKDEKIKVPIINAETRLNGHSTIMSLLYDHGFSSYRLGVARNKALVGGGPSEIYWESVLKVGSALGYPVETANVKMKGGRTTMWDVGYSYDPGEYLVQAEAVVTRSDSSMVQDQNAWYVMTGYRWGKLTPYVAYSAIKSKQGQPKNAAVCQPPSDQSEVCRQYAFEAFFINLFDRRADQHVENNTWTIGTRYDFHPNMAMKLQWDHVRKPASPVSNVGVFSNFCGSSDGFCTEPTWGRTKHTVNLLTLSVDFVF